MIYLEKVIVHNYKSLETEQEFEVEKDITVLVGKNEAGKTATLEAIAKCNYFENDAQFQFNSQFDYPRRNLRRVSKENNNDLQKVKATTLKYVISKDLINSIKEEIHLEIDDEFSIAYHYDKGVNLINFNSNGDLSEVISKNLQKANVKKDSIEKLKVSKELKEFMTLKAELDIEIDKEYENKIVNLLEFIASEKYSSWTNKVDAYIYSNFLVPNIPKFMYFDEYYELESDIALKEISNATNANLSSSQKTGKAFLELADINVDNVLDDEQFERHIAELEATQAIIADELFKYWKSNENLSVVFGIKPQKDSYGKVIDNILNIRISNNRTGVSLPLSNRSKGFNWFFSFLVWFMKIQESGNGNYILLLDEPGLNLHAKAQEDLLRFIEELSNEYQIIYTTHSPFMVDSAKFDRVRTIFEDNITGTRISDSIDETDSDTLFPLQAALGYNIAQNIFISKKNLVVEGTSDLLYLEAVSNTLKEKGMEGLNDDITIMPVGGADKVATFISLLRGNDLNIVCLLDTFEDQKAEARLSNMVSAKLISDKNILFYDEFTEYERADCEDIFLKEEYLEFYNNTIGKDNVVLLKEIDENKRILKQLNNGKRFNHYSPALYFTKNNSNITLSEQTLKNFESMFEKINKLLK